MRTKKEIVAEINSNLKKGEIFSEHEEYVGIIERDTYGWKENVVGFSIDHNTHCCGIPEFGNFYGYKETRFKALIEYHIVTQKKNWFSCTTPLTKAYKTINQALTDLGFKQLVVLNASEGRYKVCQWIYQRPMEKEKGNDTKTK